MTANARCAVTDCYVPRKHVKACTDDACPGCVPGLAMDGLLICQPHRDMGVKALKSLPRLDSDLLSVLGGGYRSPQAPKGEGGRTTDRRDALALSALGDDDQHPGVFELRQEIYEALSAACGYVVTERHRPRHRAGIVPAWDVPSMARYLLKFADWMSADPVQAPHWALKFDGIAYDARRLIQRSRVVGVYLGACPMTTSKDGVQVDCGGPIRDKREVGEQRSDIIECPWCHHKETPWWWASKINPGSRKLARATALGAASYLAQKYLIDFTIRGTFPDEARIRRWATRPVAGRHVPGCPGSEECAGCRPAITPVGCSLRSHRLLYDMAEVEAHARKVYKLVDRDLEEPAA